MMYKYMHRYNYAYIIIRIIIGIIIRIIIGIIIRIIIGTRANIYSFFVVCVAFLVAHMETKFCEVSRIKSTRIGRPEPWRYFHENCSRLKSNNKVKKSFYN